MANFLRFMAFGWVWLLGPSLLMGQPQAIINFPYHQSFDGPGFVPQNSQPTPGAPSISLGEGWENDQQDAPQDWAVRSGPTATSGTGPTADHTSGSGNYLLVEDGFGNFSNVSLLSPWFDLSGMICPKASFWSHHYSQFAVSNLLHIDLLDTLGWHLDVIPPLTASSQDQWQAQTLALGGYTGRVRLRFRVNNSLTGGQNDIALDDVRLFDDLESDLGVRDILAPLTDCNLTSQETIKVALENTGCVTASPVFLRCYVNGALVAFEEVFGGVAPGMIRHFTLPGTYDFSQTGPYQLNVQVDVGNDSDYGNNSLTSSLIHHTGASSLSSWQGDTACLDGRARLQASGSDSLVVWYDSQGQLQGSGDSWQTPPLHETTLYQAGAALTRQEYLGTPLGSSGFLTIGAFAELDPQRDLRLDSLSVHTAATDTLQVQVYLRTGGYAGFEQSPAAWTQVATLSCQGQGSGNWTRLPLPDLTLRAGQTYGLLVAADAPLACSPGPVQASSAGLKLRSQAAVQSLWGPQLANQQGWNGQLHFRTILCAGPLQPVMAEIPPSARVDFGPDTTLCEQSGFSLEAGPGSSYAWSDGSSQQSLSVSQAGVYWVEKTSAAGCVSADTLSVAVLPAPYVKQVVLTEPACAGDATGQLAVAASGGSGPLSYQWQGGPADSAWSGLAAGLYALSVTDSAGCSLDTSLLLHAPDSLLLAAELGGPLCAHDSTGTIDLRVSGGTPPYQIAWSHGFTGEDPAQLPPGSYQASVIDDRGCQASRDWLLEAELGPPQAGFSYQALGDSVQFFNQSLAADQFSWNFGDGSPPVSGPDPVHVFPSAGTYDVTLVAVSPCGTDTLEATLSLFPVQVEAPNRSGIRLAQGAGQHWGWFSGGTPVTVDLLDGQGRQLLRQQVQAPVAGQPYLLALPASLPTGLYIWRVVQGKQLYWKKWHPAL